MKDRPDIADNTWFSDEAHFYSNAQVSKGLTHVSWVQKIIVLINNSLNGHKPSCNQYPQEPSERRFATEGTSHCHLGKLTLFSEGI